MMKNAVWFQRFNFRYFNRLFFQINYNIIRQFFTPTRRELFWCKTIRINFIEKLRINSRSGRNRFAFVMSHIPTSTGFTRFWNGFYLFFRFRWWRSTTRWTFRTSFFRFTYVFPYIRSRSGTIWSRSWTSGSFTWCWTFWSVFIRCSRSSRWFLMMWSLTRAASASWTPLFTQWKIFLRSVKIKMLPIVNQVF